MKRDIYENGGYLCWDIPNIRQFKYGTRPNEEQKKNYLVDSEPRMRRYDPEHRERAVVFIETYLDGIVDFINKIQEKTGQQFDSVKKEFSSLLDKILKIEPEIENYQKVKTNFNKLQKSTETN